jgi:hypothetical protein
MKIKPLVEIFVAPLMHDYANKNNEDFNALKQAVKEGRVEACFER